MTNRMIALGDSFSCGIGVGVVVPGDQTWVGLLGAALELDIELLATPGLASVEVLHDQVPVATHRPATLATLLVGLNDIVRAAFDADDTRTHVEAIVDELCAVHDVVLVARLHNAVARLPLPREARRRYAERIAAVNAALTDAVAAQHNAVLFCLDEIQALHARCSWAVDRIHPSRSGHHAIASAALGALHAHGAAPVSRLNVIVMPDQPASLLAEIIWFLRHGGPWLARRLPKVVFGRPVDGERIAARGHIELETIEPGGGRASSRAEQVVHR
jgi:lysophospholipase L1-like esterase